MSKETFRKVLWAVTVVGLLSAVALVGYTYFLQRQCSIISYIANRG